MTAVGVVGGVALVGTLLGGKKDDDTKSDDPFADWEEVTEEEKAARAKAAEMPNSEASAELLPKEKDDPFAFNEADMMSALRDRMSTISLEDDDEAESDLLQPDQPAEDDKPFEYGGTAMLERPDEDVPESPAPAPAAEETAVETDGLPDSLNWDETEFDDSIETAPAQTTYEDLDRLNKMFKL